MPTASSALHAIQRMATANGAPAQWLSAAEARALEPALQCTAALHSPTTGIVDSHALMLALQGDLEHVGGRVAFGIESPGLTSSLAIAERVAELLLIK